MTVEADPSERDAVPVPRAGIPAATQPAVEALIGLRWSQAVELPRTASAATTPAGLRRAWIHRARTEQVLELFRSASAGGAHVPSPWWLRALARGDLDSRADGFRVEDRVAQLLTRRPGWEFVPWAADGESGCWEFLPSEHGPNGHAMPTAVLLTDRHPGWIDVLPAHAGSTPEPIAVAGLAGLRARLGEIEAIR